MKKIAIPFLICLSGAFLLNTSCKQKAGSGKTYTLKMQLKQGDKFSQDMDMSMKMNLAMMGQDMNMDMDMKGATTFEVVSSTEEMKELKMTYNKMTMSAKMKTPDGKTNNMGNNDAGDKLEGKSVTLKLNNKNEIVEVTGVEDAMWGDSTDMAAREELKKMFSKEQMDRLYGMMFQMYPDKPVQVGETWEKETEAGIGEITMKMKAKYTLSSVKDGVAYIDMNGNYAGKGKMKQGNTDMEMELDGGQKGTINIGLDDGYLKDSQVTMDIKANMNVMGQKIPVTIKGNYLIKAK